MTIRSLGVFGASAFLVALCVSIPALAQDSTTGWTAPRTVDGHPDLQGVWANNNATPLQRPEILGDREQLTPEELASLQSRAGELFAQDSGDAGVRRQCLRCGTG